MRARMIIGSTSLRMSVLSRFSITFSMHIKMLIWICAVERAKRREERRDCEEKAFALVPHKAYLSVGIDVEKLLGFGQNHLTNSGLVKMIDHLRQC